MAVESIRNVRRAEAQAEELVDDASEQSDRLMSDGRFEASDRIAAAEERAREEGERIRRELLQEAEAEVEQIEQEAEKERQRIRERGPLFVDSAVKVVLDSITDGGM
jgi:V/A-type H+-transporting ATPase subunit G/H